jgi:hypothetical protein
MWAGCLHSLLTQWTYLCDATWKLGYRKFIASHLNLSSFSCLLCKARWHDVSFDVGRNWLMSPGNNQLEPEACQELCEWVWKQVRFDWTEMWTHILIKAFWETLTQWYSSEQLPGSWASENVMFWGLIGMARTPALEVQTHELKSQYH